MSSCYESVRIGSGFVMDLNTSKRYDFLVKSYLLIILVRFFFYDSLQNKLSISSHMTNNSDVGLRPSTLHSMGHACS
jgi:hypothetical protein